MRAAVITKNVLVNGEDSAVFPVSDRGLQYGHGVFETIAIKEGQPEHWDQHMARLVKGCVQLSIKKPDLSLLKKEALQLANNIDKAVVKIIYTGGEGDRGYKTPELPLPNRILSISEWPDYPHQNFLTGVVVRLCENRLGSNPILAGIKHLNRLEQILARSEWTDSEIAEGIMLDMQGHVIEGTMSNVFFVKNNTLCTPQLNQCGVAGVMREVVLDLAESFGINIYIDDFTPGDIFQADELFLTNSLIGIWAVNKIFSDNPIVYDQPGTITSRLIETIRKEE